MHELPTIHKNACLANDTYCLKCAFDNCNKDDSLLKTEFCIGCDSLNDPNCLNSNINTEVRCLTNECFSRLVKNADESYHVQRGCLADLTTCSGPGCDRCVGRNCNNKIFPQQRISCKFCEFGTCHENVRDKICNKYITDEACVTIFDDDNQVAIKDCYSDVVSNLQTFCDDPTNLECTKCKGSQCNVDTKRRGNKCYKCEGVECVNLDISNEIECSSECYVGINKEGYPKRDCASAVTTASRCGITDLTCLTCDDDLCNGITHPIENRLSCKKCSGEECTSSEENFEFCERWNPSERCVSVFSLAGTILERGCSSSIQKNCSSSALSCLTCALDDCNVETSPAHKYHCVSCDSKEDPKCISNTNATQTIGCTTNQCYSRLLSSGQYIERGCGTAVQSCSNASCQTCTGEKCNSGVFPSDRHSCLHCVGDQCQMGHATPKLCNIYNQDTSCITIFGQGRTKSIILSYFLII